MVKSVYAQILLFCCTLGFVKCYSQNGHYFENQKYCDDLSPAYGNIDLEQISGIWYGVEKIPHTRGGEYRIERSRDCFYVDIKELNIEPTPPPPYSYSDRDPSYNYNNYNNNNNYNSLSYMSTVGPYGYNYNRPFGQEEYRIRHFVLEWHEGLWQNDYHIKVNTSHKGFWPTDVPNASVDKMYRFFGGVIQVLKVAHNHLVLNFCMRLPHSQMFSVVLSRNEHQLTSEDLAHIHNVFTMKHLSTSSLKRVCDNGATVNLPSIFLLTILLLVCRS